MIRELIDRVTMKSRCEARASAGTHRRHNAMNTSSIISVLLIAILLGFGSPSVAAESRKSTRIQGKDYVSVNDAALLLDATKFWKLETRKAVLNVQGKRILFTVGSPVVAVGSQTYVLRAAVLFIKGVPYIPVDFFVDVVPQISEKQIAWDPDDKTLSLLKKGVVPVRLSLESSGDFTYLTIQSPEKVEYSPVSLSKESFIIVLENAVVSGKPSAEKAGVIRRLLVSQSGAGVELRFALDSRTAGYGLKQESKPERLILAFTSSESQMRNMGYVPFGGEQPHGAFRVVVLDAAHGGSDEGVKGSGGAIEKQVNLEIARDVKSALAASGTLDVVLTREDDSEKTAEARIAKANAADGSIFVRIECDGYASPNARGYCVEVYRAPNGSGSASSEAAAGGIQMRSWKSVAGSYTRTSLSLAGAISDKLSGTGLKELGLRRVPALALEGVDMPCVVLCCGFLTNPGDEALLLDSSSRRKIATAIADGISQFVREESK